MGQRQQQAGMGSAGAGGEDAARGAREIGEGREFGLGEAGGQRRRDCRSLHRRYAAPASTS